MERSGFYALLARYPDRVVDYAVVRDELPYEGYASHRRALALACREIMEMPGEEPWQYDAAAARGEKTAADVLFAPVCGDDALNCRRAFLRPPHGNGYTDADFDRLNAALFPNGADALEVYEWTTDWSDYFDEGHEWWGTLCLTVYDRSEDRFAVIMASATD